MTSSAICVLGMHRSGTSAFTGVLWHLGVELGKKLVPAKSGVNDRGFWEHDDVVDLHQRLLETLEYSWDDVRPLGDAWWRLGAVVPFRDELVALLRRNFAGTMLWGVKDPRLCRLLPLWLDAFPELGATPCFVHLYRHPLEVARSLGRRDGFVLEKSLLLWIEHNLVAERWSRDFPRIFIGFDRFLTEPEATMERTGLVLGCTWPKPVSLAMPEIRHFLAPNLRHEVAADATDDRYRLADLLIADSFEALRAAERGETPQSKSVFDELTRRLEARVASFDPAVIGHIRDLQRRHTSLRSRLHDIRSSASWRVTRPVRGIERLLGSIISKRI